MSLRIFHFIFIMLSALLAFGFAAWLYKNYQAENNTTELVLAIVSVVVGVALIAYEIWFVRKTKKIL